VTCKASKIYHAKAAAQRIENALKASISAEITSDADLVLKVRIDDNLCTFSIDTSGAALHIRGHKEFVGKAPMRENRAALFMRQCGFAGDEPVLDPMCGSGTFPIEAAEIAQNVAPGRSRNFAFENLASFEAAEWQNLKLESKPRETNVRFYGSDRDSGAIRGAQQNAARSGVEAITAFSNHAFSDLQRPDGPPGLIMINPPYGGRIGNKKLLYGLYGALGKTLLERFSGWRVGMVTSEKGLAMASGLPFFPQTAPIPHGGIRITLFQTAPLP
jgi:putative N6-adenine-specific DNA methylase